MLGDDDRKPIPACAASMVASAAAIAGTNMTLASTMLLPGLLNRVIDRDAVTLLPAPAGRRPGDDTPATDLARVAAHQPVWNRPACR